MTFKKVIIFSLKEFNDNKPNDGYSPQNGHVINVFFSANRLTECVAVGFQ
ncbi:hypothetical protein I6N95_07910 [Vagococcus sp. BWB3-3]|uniref:Uncharacterized protein n=1 Tax=Vagococcus allomyrinae TaxID=2794353 RepID=A0A940PCF0_9ENTE|nr:hypothetical protein [Vagococcus allomyrinae]MBP1040926.1 hypothetical protein [Vagococcus allomyrinae]